MRKLKSAAGEIEGQIANAERNWNNLCETVKASGNYWEGEAADCGRRLLEKMMQDVQEVFARLKEHPKDLLEMAGIYLDVETKAGEMANALPEDAIE